ncbi:hypothetical protein GOBAR_AA32695 [Gossypium barbadense]|uniref:Uncharacterized protein n=1 Tax=Gossypium barbadense TaxID=3634 RepID=A0A2P5WA77_GOSBA|nr:hypothetical protein GOBAR_AA32695 [Gossypium barbadense]
MAMVVRLLAVNMARVRVVRLLAVKVVRERVVRLLGNKGDEGVEGQGVKEGGEVAEGLGGEGDDVDVHKGGESDGGDEEGVDIAVSVCGGSDGGGKERVRDESDTDSKDKNAYLIKVMYLLDGDDDDDKL